MYSPTMGRFLQTDPVGYQDDLNWYAYVGNNPVNFTDPDGTFLANVAMGVVNAGVGIGVSLATGQRDIQTLVLNAGVDFIVGAMAGPVAGGAARAGAQLATKTGQSISTVTTKLQVGALFGLGAGGETAKSVLNNDSVNAQTITGVVMGGIIATAPGASTALSAASKVSGISPKMVTAIDNVYSGAATGLASTTFSSSVGRATTKSASGFK